MRYKIEWFEFTNTYTPEVDNRKYGIFKSLKDGREVSSKDLPIGACYETKDMPPDYVGYDGKSIVCKTPDGHWYIDSRASNCTKKNDKVHKCWVRHGTVGDTNLHVDKVGNTCAAGAGSIQMSKFHGYLRNGELYDC